MLESRLLELFMARFFGYGDLSARHWFVGMEEGGGNSEAEVASRLQRWRDLGGETTLDMPTFHEAVSDERGSLGRFFDDRPPLQRTWNGLIRILLAAETAEAPSSEDVREVQAQRWGRRRSDTCLLELLPLPSPGLDTWNYHHWSCLPYLKTRASYSAHLRPLRTASLRHLVQTHAPSSIVFYGTSPDYSAAWSEVTGVQWSAVSPETITMRGRQPLQARFAHLEDTFLAVIRHPIARGNTSNYFYQVGLRLHKNGVN